MAAKLIAATIPGGAMFKTRAVCATAVVIAAIATGHFVIAQAGTASNLGDQFTVTAHFTSVEDEATHQPPTSAIPPGDTFVGKGSLSQAGTVIGEARFACTGAFEPIRICNGVWTFAQQGSLVIAGGFNVSTGTSDFAVTGGTREFAGKDGWVHITTLANGDEVNAFHLGG
jgi:hypothetical protein